MTTNPGPHLFWITSRAAGTVALVLASLAVSLGLLGIALRGSHGSAALAFWLLAFVTVLMPGLVAAGGRRVAFNAPDGAEIKSKTDQARSPPQ